VCPGLAANQVARPVQRLGRCPASDLRAPWTTCRFPRSRPCRRTPMA